MMFSAGRHNQIKENADKQLSSKYEIQVLKLSNTHVQIFGISECYEDHTLKHYILKQNANIFSIISNKKTQRCISVIVPSGYGNFSVNTFLVFI